MAEMKLFEGQVKVQVVWSTLLFVALLVVVVVAAAVVVVVVVVAIVILSDVLRLKVDRMRKHSMDLVLELYMLIQKCETDGVTCS